ncbi:MAG: DUF1854 domain-containing protein [Gemmatimonadota bacterium]|nr:DUF1854 domain-containing protein [Gemmatimonadota bacterium]
MGKKLREVGGLRIERRADGQLWAELDGESRPVWVRRCFPWSEPTRFISLLDDGKKEVALVPDIGQLDPGSREALEAALAEAGFVLEIERIEAVEEEVEIRTWSVLTRQGPRSFQTRRDDWPREVPGGGYLIRDVAGDLYYVSDPRALDPKSVELLWAFVG